MGKAAFLFLGIQFGQMQRRRHINIRVAGVLHEQHHLKWAACPHNPWTGGNRDLDHPRVVASAAGDRT